MPLGAKIIKVCDAIDAMLSDRPYRPALTLDHVKEELAKYAGQQFDPGIVTSVLQSQILEAHVEAIQNQLHAGEERLEREMRPRKDGPGSSVRPRRATAYGYLANIPTP